MVPGTAQAARPPVGDFSLRRSGGLPHRRSADNTWLLHDQSERTIGRPAVPTAPPAAVERLTAAQGSARHADVSPVGRDGHTASGPVTAATTRSYDPRLADQAARRRSASRSARSRWWHATCERVACGRSDPRPRPDDSGTTITSIISWRMPMRFWSSAVTTPSWRRRGAELFLRGVGAASDLRRRPRERSRGTCGRNRKRISSPPSRSRWACRRTACSSRTGRRTPARTCCSRSGCSPRGGIDPADVHRGAEAVYGTPELCDLQEGVAGKALLRDVAADVDGRSI